MTIVNIRNNPGEVLDSFFIKTHLLCIVSVPGAKTNDLLGSSGITLDDNSGELKLSQRKHSKSEDVSPQSSISLSSCIQFAKDSSTDNSEPTSLQNEVENKKGMSRIGFVS